MLSTFQNFKSLRRQIATYDSGILEDDNDSSTIVRSEEEEKSPSGRPKKQKKEVIRKIKLPEPLTNEDGKVTQEELDEYMTQLLQYASQQQKENFVSDAASPRRSQSNRPSNIQYRLFRKKAIQEQPNIMSKTRGRDVEDFQKEQVHFVTNKLVSAGETEFFENNKHLMKG